MGNAQAVWALLAGLLAVAVLAAAAAAARMAGVFLEAVPAVAVAAFLGLLALSLARRARLEHERTLGRGGGETLAALARGLGVTALVVTLTAGVALAVFGVLLLVSALT